MDGRKALLSRRSPRYQKRCSYLLILDEENDDALKRSQNVKEECKHRASDDEPDVEEEDSASQGFKNVKEGCKHRTSDDEPGEDEDDAETKSFKNVKEECKHRASDNEPDVEEDSAIKGFKNVKEGYKHSASDDEPGIGKEVEDAALKGSTNMKEGCKHRAFDDEPGEEVEDAALKGSTNIKEGCKHRAFDDELDAKEETAALKDFKNRKCVYNFSWIDILFAVGSILLFFVDVVTDVKLAVDYFVDAEWILGGLTTALIVVPSLVTCCFGLHWYFIDYKREKRAIKEDKCSVHVTPPYVWFFRFFFTALQFGPVVRKIEYLYYGLKSRSKKLNEEERRRFYRWMLYEDVDSCLLQLFEGFLESAPQLSWQLYITITRNPDDDLIGTITRAAALLSSWCSLAVSLVSYHRSLRKCQKDKCKMQLVSIPFYFIWRACEVGARILCIALFASAFEMWVFGILLLHWVVISGLLMIQRTTFYNHRCLERVFNIICGYVMLFCFLNLREGHTRYRFLIFYIIFYIENFFMLAFWFRFTTDQGTWYHLWGFIAVLILFILHVIFQPLYYYCFHPTGAIGLSCDKYTFYESVCYDVRQEMDDGIGSPNPRDTGQEIEM